MQRLLGEVKTAEQADEGGQDAASNPRAVAGQWSAREKRNKVEEGEGKPKTPTADPKNNLVYFATGTSQGGPTSPLPGAGITYGQQDNYAGTGVYKSTDYGITWTLLTGTSQASASR